MRLLLNVGYYPHCRGSCLHEPHFLQFRCMRHAPGDGDVFLYDGLRPSLLYDPPSGPGKSSQFRCVRRAPGQRDRQR